MTRADEVILTIIVVLATGISLWAAAWFVYHGEQGRFAIFPPAVASWLAFFLVTLTDTSPPFGLILIAAVLFLAYRATRSEAP